MTIPAFHYLSDAYHRTTHQELVNTATHGFGCFLSLIGGAYVVAVASATGNVAIVAACLAYAVTMIAVYAISTLSHGIRQPRWKRILQIWDQGVIYLFIVGTYTPFIVAFGTAGLRWWVLAACWAMGLAGFYSKVAIRHRIDQFAAWSYIALGWGPAMFLCWMVPLPCLYWIGLGGLCYTVGTLFLIHDHKHDHFHAVWHLLVIGGTVSHFVAVVGFVV